MTMQCVENQLYPLDAFLCRSEQSLPPKGALVRIWRGKNESWEEIVVSHFECYWVHSIGGDRAYRKFQARKIYGLNPILHAEELFLNPNAFTGEEQMYRETECTEWVTPSSVSEDTITLVAQNYFIYLQAHREKVAGSLVTSFPTPVIGLVQDFMA